MKTLHIRATNFYGGPERQVHLHAKEAIGSDCEVLIGSFKEPGGVPELIRMAASDGIRTHVFDVQSAYDFRATKMLGRFIDENGIDILCTHDYRTTLYGWWLSRRRPLAWIAFSRGFTTTNLKVRLYQGLEKALSRYADAVVAVSGAQAQKMRAFGVPDQKLFAIRNAIDVRRTAAVESVDLRGRLKLPGDSVLCVAAGRFSKEKGQDVLVRAAAIALRREPRLRFLLFGGGPELGAVEQLIRELGVQDSVFCPGFEREVLGCLKGADMVVNPSWTEGMPNVVLEGMALGVPVIATAVGGVPEIIEDGETGVLVQPGDLDGIADAIVRLTTDSGRSERIGAAGREFVSLNCTFRSQFEALSDVYQRVLVNRQGKNS